MKEVINLQGDKELVPLDTVVKTVNGQHYLLSLSEREQFDSETNAYMADSVRRNALAEIRRLEGLVSQRRIREAVLGIDNGWLANQESLISLERAKLV